MKLSPSALGVLASMLATLSMFQANAFRADASPPVAPQTLSAADSDFFESKIRPLLVKHCYECHSHESGESEGELYLDSAHAVLSGGSLGPSLIPGDAAKSLLFRAVKYDNASLQMPPEGKLSSDQIEAIRQWIERGAPDPRIGKQGDPSDDEPKTSPMDIDPRSHWAFNVPQKSSTRSPVHRSDIDRIDTVARAVADKNAMTVARRSEDSTLIRRIYHDLTGLPPTRDQVIAFVESKRPDKMERLVDSLLATPDFAERFARHWMDVARYADTIGYATAGKERRILGSERYRDWLIRSFAKDMPYDQMIRLQLAGDSYDPENENGDLDAMGFLTIGRRFLNRFDTIDDRIDVITRGLLGMTVTCARCHDHKFDPIPTQDYYSLLGVLQSSEQPKDGASPLMMKDKKKPADSRVFLRGQPGSRGDVAPRQYLTALRSKEESRFTEGSGRRELADKIASSDNPLVARVFVNRVWSHLVGRPIVDSTSDFGVRTQEPPLVEVLDELSAEFTDHWSLKKLVRRIVLSRVYSQSASASQDAISQDPDNRFASRGNRKRRDFESMRDSMLCVSDQLDRRVGGEPVEVHLNSPVPRKTLYAMIDRQNLPSLFRTFDFASPDAHAPKRYATTVPQQALFLLNHPQSGSLAKSVANQLADSNPESTSFVRALFGAILARDPSPSELEQCQSFLSKSASKPIERFAPNQAWQYGTAPVNSNSEATGFRPFRIFSGSSWQDSAKLPAKSELSYASLGLENGHPGPHHAVVRRWVSPASGSVSVSGMVGHRNQMGDGIELAIWIGGKRIWRQPHKSNNRPFDGLSGKIRKGQTVDFVVSPRESDSFDSFFLRCQVSLRGDDGTVYEGDSKRDFSGPSNDASSQTLDRVEQLAQTLLISNEFIFVD